MDFPFPVDLPPGTNNHLDLRPLLRLATMPMDSAKSSIISSSCDAFENEPIPL